MGLKDMAGKYCTNGACGLKLSRRPEESIEEFEVRELCGRCEAQAHATNQSTDRHADGAGKKPQALKFGGSRD